MLWREVRDGNLERKMGGGDVNERDFCKNLLRWKFSVHTQKMMIERDMCTYEDGYGSL